MVLRIIREICFVQSLNVVLAVAGTRAHHDETFDVNVRIKETVIVVADILVVQDSPYGVRQKAARGIAHEEQILHAVSFLQMFDGSYDLGYFANDAAVRNEGIVLLATCMLKHMLISLRP